MNEVSADHASMYHTGISGLIRTSVRLPALRYELLPSGLTFMSCQCVSYSPVDNGNF
jgi:hypothetical protein